MAGRSITDAGRYEGVVSAAALLGDRWTLIIVAAALQGTSRFSRFRKLGVPSKTLARRLEWLVAAGVLARGPSSYRLTEAGRALAPVIDAMQHWSTDFAPVTRLEGLRWSHRGGHSASD